MGLVVDIGEGVLRYVQRNANILTLFLRLLFGAFLLVCCGFLSNHPLFEFGLNFQDSGHQTHNDGNMAWMRLVPCLNVEG